MRLSRIVVTLIFLILTSPSYAAGQCPTADEVRNCHGDDCSWNRIPGWSTEVFYTDHGKPFTYQKTKVEASDRGRRVSCYYTYIDPENNRAMPPAIVLRTIID